MIEAALAWENLALAWEQVRANGGGPGVDGVTLARWGRNWEANLERLREQVRGNTYHPNRPKRFTVRKKDGGTRELARLTIADKVLQRAVLNGLEPLYEPRFLACSHGYRRNRSVATAVQQVLVYRDAGWRWLLDADIEACFDSLNHDLLMRLLRRVVTDWHVLNLTELWLLAGRKFRHQGVGVPMGAVLSPFWANVILHQMDAHLSTAGFKLVRYADDFIILAQAEAGAAAAREAAAASLARLGLRLSERKTRAASFEGGFEFLGVRFVGDTYSYLWQDKRVTVRGRKLKMLYSHLPEFYGREG